MPIRRSSGRTAAAYSAGVSSRTPFVADAETAAKIDVLEREAVLAQLPRQRYQRARRACERLCGRDLRSDVDVHADELRGSAGARRSA